MARTLHQAMAYLGLGQVEQDDDRANRARRHPETVYEETVFEADDRYEQYAYESDRPAETVYADTAERDVLRGISPETSRYQTDRAGYVDSKNPEDLSSEEGNSWEPLPIQSSYSGEAAVALSNQESSEELSRITTIHPRSYNDAKIIGESFRENIPVIMNVTDMGDNDAKRLIDFSAGLAFALNGHIERVTDKVFLLTPANLEVLGAEGVEVPVALDSDDVTPFNQI